MQNLTLKVAGLKYYVVWGIIILVGCYLVVWSAIYMGYDQSSYLRTENSGIVGKKRALIVSVSEFHYEIMIFFAWQLTTLGYHVTVWTLPPNPFKAYFDVSVLKHIADNTHYIYRWFPLTYLNPWLPATPIDALVFITAEREIEYLQERQLLTPLMTKSKYQFLVNHHSDDLGTYIPGRSPQLVYNCRPESGCTVVHLANHIGRAALGFAHANESEISLLNSYPVFNLTQVFPDIKYSNPLSLLENANQNHDNKPNPIQLIIQGNVQSKRRHYDDLLRTLDKHLDQAWELTILGVGAAKFAVPANMQNRIRTADKLSFEAYYRTISKADLVLSFLSESMNYGVVRATSTVPTAILSGVPVLLTNIMLPLYACLGDSSVSPLHSAIARDDDAASLTAFFALSDENKTRLKQEARFCLASWQRDNKHKFQQRVSSTSNSH
jgi:hypothetical protein